MERRRTTMPSLRNKCRARPDTDHLGVTLTPRPGGIARSRQDLKNTAKPLKRDPAPWPAYGSRWIPRARTRSHGKGMSNEKPSTENTSKPSYSDRSDIDKPRRQNKNPFSENDFPKQITRAAGKQHRRADRRHDPLRPHTPNRTYNVPCVYDMVLRVGTAGTN